MTCCQTANNSSILCKLEDESIGRTRGKFTKYFVLRSRSSCEGAVYEKNAINRHYVGCFSQSFSEYSVIFSEESFSEAFRMYGIE